MFSLFCRRFAVNILILPTLLSTSTLLSTLLSWHSISKQAKASKAYRCDDARYALLAFACLLMLCRGKVHKSGQKGVRKVVSPLDDYRRVGELGEMSRGPFVGDWVSPSSSADRPGDGPKRGISSPPLTPPQSRVRASPRPRTRHRKDPYY